MPITAEPIGWTECGTGIDDPPQCARACVQDVCPGDSDAAVLQECALESPCAPHEGCGAPDDLQCVLVALRDRVPGRYEFTIGLDYGSWQPTRWLVVVTDSGVAQATRKDGWEMGCDAPLGGLWGPAQSCTLADPQVFDDCLAGAEPCTVDVCPAPGDIVGALLVDCIDMPASCP